MCVNLRFLLFIFLPLCLLILVAEKSSATEQNEYYASIRANEANVRTGPSARYPIQWVYRRRDWPIRILASFEQWKKIKDRDGQEGWVHEVLISHNRHVIIQGEDVVKGYRLPTPTSSPTVMFEKDVVAELLKCKSGWCKVESSSHEAWLEQSYLWGVDEGEVFE